MFLLDTNVAIAALNESNAGIAARLDAELERGASMVLSTVVLFELRFGVANSVSRARNESRLATFLTIPFVVAPFEDEDAEHAGDIRAHLKRSGPPIGPYDILIAAQARRRGSALVTANRREFDRVPGLIVEDWAT